MSGKLTVVAFYGPNCPKCKQELALVQYANVIRGHYIFKPVDVEERPYMATAYQVKTLPWFMVTEPNVGKLFAGKAKAVLAWAEERAWEGRLKCSE